MKLIIAILALCSGLAFAQEVTPTMRLQQSVTFSDDLQFQNLDLAIERQLASFDKVGLKGNIKFGTKVYPKTVLKDSLLLLRELSKKALNCQRTKPATDCLEAFNLAMNTSFAIYVPTVSKKRAKTKFTSYYSPDLHGSRVPTARFKRAIHSRPAAPHDNYTRVAIDYHGALAGKGYEIFWVEESFYDLYLLHVQGGGRINIFNADGTKDVRYLSYDGKNSRPFKMIYHYMMAQGYLQPGDAGIPGQRRFLEEHPEKEEEVFGSCPSYVYFKETTEEPVGLNNIPLTENRSLAIDSRTYKTMGMINFIKTQKASHVDANGTVVKVPFARFFISQDTGGAIRGNARCDLYFGYGPLAELTAYNMNEMGEQYFLVKK